MNVDIIPAQPRHWDAIREIYEAGIRTGDATFENEAPEWEVWDRNHLDRPRLVAIAEGAIVGWAALSPVSSRCVHAGVAEVSVYVAETCRGLGVGRELLSGLVRESEREGLWTLQAGIFPENQRSIALHESMGFRRVGVREKLGRLNGRWRNVVLLERRSSTVGV